MCALLTLRSIYGEMKQDRSKGEVPSILSRLKQIYLYEGTKALFAGVVPRTLWISAGGAVFLGAYELSVHELKGV